MISLPLKKGEAFFITDELTRKYITGVDLDTGYLLYSSKPTYLVDARFFYAVKTDIEKSGCTAKLFTSLSDVEAEIKAQNINKLYLDYDRTTLTQFNSYKSFNVELPDGSPILREVKAIKNEDELVNIRKACDIAQNAFYTVLKEIKKGVSESYIRDRLEQEMVENGAEGVSFETIVAFGKNAAVPHHKTSEDLLEDNQVVLVDMGCKVNGYCSDITRTLFFGTPDKRFIDCYDAVLEANERAIANITENTTTDVADGFARNFLEQKGLAKYFTHSLGHGVGLEIHEFPLLTPKKKDEIKNRMVFTIEPGVYFNGDFGIRIEDTVVLVDGKVERLYSDDKKLLIIK